MLIDSESCACFLDACTAVLVACMLFCVIHLRDSVLTAELS
jgi:hypothetical protein